MEKLIITGTGFELIETSTNKREGVFIAGIAPIGDEETLIEVKLSLSDIYQKLDDSGDCIGFEDTTDSRGEHTTKDVWIEPADKWEEMSDSEKLEWILDDLKAFIQENELDV